MLEIAKPEAKNMKLHLALLAIVLVFAIGEVSAMTYVFQQDLGVQGLIHLCQYSNDKVYSFNSIDVCPPSVEDSPPGMGQGVGFFQSEYLDGLTKVCVYDVAGQQRAIRLSNTGICPPSQQFK